MVMDDDPARCEHCQCILTVRHVVVECNQRSSTSVRALSVDSDSSSRSGGVQSEIHHLSASIVSVS